MTVPDLPPFELADPGPLRDQLVAAVLDGSKTSTSSLLLEYDDALDPVPRAGERAVLVGSREEPLAVIETTEVRLVRLADVDLPFAVEEGEGYESVAAWRETHEGFWRAHAPQVPLDDDTVVVAQHFRLVEVLGPGGEAGA